MEQPDKVLWSGFTDNYLRVTAPAPVDRNLRNSITASAWRNSTAIHCMAHFIRLKSFGRGIHQKPRTRY